MHGHRGRIVKGVQHLSSECVPLYLRILLRHTNITTHTPVVSVEPGGSRERERKREVGGKSIKEGGKVIEKGGRGLKKKKKRKSSSNCHLENTVSL